jgi:head-tail adaptor
MTNSATDVFHASTSSVTVRARLDIAADYRYAILKNIVTIASATFDKTTLEAQGTPH